MERSRKGGGEGGLARKATVYVLSKANVRI